MYIISFIDMLGSSERIRTLSVDELLSQYELFYNLNNDNHWYNSVINECNIDVHDYFIFSDLVVRTINIEQEEKKLGWSYLYSIELCKLAEIQYKLITDFVPIFPSSGTKTLMRGCINLGELYIDSKRNIIFGNGLIDSFKKESEIAIYPRIMIDDTLITKEIELNLSNINFKQYLTTQGIFTQQFNDTLSCIRKDNDGIYFLDYLKLYILTHTSIDPLESAFSAIQKHRISICSLAKEEMYSTNIKAKQKLFWLINYHNLVTNEYKEFSKELIFTDFDSNDFEELKIITAI